MAQFTFKYEEDNRVVETKIETETWIEAVSEFENFIRGCGFVVDNYSSLRWVNEDGDLTYPNV